MKEKNKVKRDAEIISEAIKILKDKKRVGDVKNFLIVSNQDTTISITFNQGE